MLVVASRFSEGTALTHSRLSRSPCPNEQFKCCQRDRAFGRKKDFAEDDVLQKVAGHVNSGVSHYQLTVTRRRAQRSFLNIDLFHEK
jgi:hypothetical protein